MERDLDAANARIANLENELSARDETENESLRNLQDQFESLQKNTEEQSAAYGSIQDELTVANDTVSTLESGKAKAKAEIHSLLRRVQDSERWMKLTKETLEKLGIHPADDSSQEIWNTLEMALRERAQKSMPAPSSSHSLQRFGAVNKENEAPNNVGVALTPRRSGASPPEGYLHTTEFSYRTHSIQQSAYSSPRSQRAVQSAPEPSAKHTIPDSQVSANIVPFSSIQQHLSPEHGCSPSESDLAKIFAFSPGKDTFSGPQVCHENSTGVLASEKGNRDRGSRHSSLAAQKRQGAGEDAAGDRTEGLGTSRHGLKRKAVTFDTNRPASSERRSEIPESLNGNSQNSQSGVTIKRKPSRSNQRTYGKSQHSRMARKSSLRETVSYAFEDTENPELPQMSPHGGKAGRPEDSAASQHRPQTQTRKSSDYFETRTSPASLVSGSSRRSSAIGQHSKEQGTTRRPRHGRRSRGRLSLA